jgi:putative peptidyl-prolyl cis-trans isomerase
MKKFKFIALILFFSYSLSAWEPYDKVIALVNGKPIIETNLLKRLDESITKRKNELKQLRGNRQAAKRVRELRKENSQNHTIQKSRVLDTIINETLIKEIATKESIIISNLKISDYIENIARKYFSTKYSGKKIKKFKKDMTLLMDRVKYDLGEKENNKIIKSDKANKLYKQFIVYITNQTGQTFANYVRDIKLNLIRQQVMSVAIGVAAPSMKEAFTWYKKNKKKFGFNARIKHIQVNVKNLSFKKTRLTYKELKAILKKIERGMSLEKAVAILRKKRKFNIQLIDTGWIHAAKMDPYLIRYISRLKPGGVFPEVVQSQSGSYHILKYLGKKPIPFSSAKNIILNILYEEKMKNEYKTWISEKRSSSTIVVFMENYTKE